MRRPGTQRFCSGGVLVLLPFLVLVLVGFITLVATLVQRDIAAIRSQTEADLDALAQAGALAAELNRRNGMRAVQVQTVLDGSTPGSTAGTAAEIADRFVSAGASGGAEPSAAVPAISSGDWPVFESAAGSRASLPARATVRPMLGDRPVTVMDASVRNRSPLVRYEAVLLP